MTHVFVAPHPDDVALSCGGLIASLREQLGEGGRLVIPVGSRDRQLLTIVTRHGNDWFEETDGYCVFVPLIGAEGFAG